MGVGSPACLDRGKSGVTILVVEDDEPVRTLICAMLAQFGYGILEAGNGEDALQVLEHHGDRIALVITDVVMPRMDGRDLARKLQENKPGAPVIFMSGYSDAPILEDIERMGAGFLAKPFTAVALAETVRGALEAAGPPAGA